MTQIVLNTLALLLLAIPATMPSPTTETIHTAHYDLYVEKLPAAEIGRLLEAQHALLTEYFGKAPESRLSVAIFSTPERFHDALAADHQAVVQAGGYYAPGNRKAYLFVQPSEYYTRQLTLHECAHQFHFLTATDNRSPTLSLYTEGLAEELATHSWDGTTLHISVIPPISLEDYLAHALDHFEGPLKRNLEGMLRGDVPTERPEAMALVHFLREVHPDEFKRWSSALDHSQTPAAALDAAVLTDFPKLADAFETWMKDHQAPWKVSTISWQPWGDAIEGSSPNNTVAIALLKHRPDDLRVEVKPVETPAMYGMVINHESPDAYELFQVIGNRVRLLKRANGKWIAEGDWPVVLAMGKRDALEASARADELDLSMNGKVLTSVHRGSGAVGLHVQQGRVLFWNVTTKS